MPEITDPSLLDKLNKGAPKPVFSAPDPNAGLEREGKVTSIETSRAGDARANQANSRAQATFDDQQADREASGGVNSSVEQGRAASFYLRALESQEEYEKLGIGAPSLGRYAAQAVLPESLVNQFTDEKRQVAESKIRNFIAATLRYESGAAIPPDEFAKQYGIFFPTPGDGPDVIKAKSEARKSAIAGLRIGAGPAGKVADEKYNQLKEQYGTFEEGERQNGYDMAELRKKHPEAINFVFGEDGRIIGFTTPPDDDGVDFTIIGGDEADKEREQYLAKVEELKAQRDTAFGEIDAFVRGAADTASFGLADKAAALGNTVFSGGTYEENLANERIINQADEEVNNISRIGGQISGGVAVPFGAGARTARQLAGVGAAYGGAYNYNSSDADLLSAERLGSAAQGAVLGAAGGYAGGRIASAVAPRLGGVVNAVRNRLPGRSDLPTVDADAIAAAGLAENVPVNRAMVAPELSNKITAAESTILGGPVIRGGMQDVSNAIEGRVTNLGKGTAIDRDIAGGRIQAAVKTADKDAKAQTDRLYAKYRAESGDPPVAPEGALARVAEELGSLSRSPNTNAGEIRYLEDVKADLSGEMTVDTLLNLRRSMRGQIRERNLGLTQAEARVQGILEAAGDDIAKKLDPNSTAYKLLQQANKSHQERAIFKKQVMAQLIGKDKDIPVDPEKALQIVERWAKPGGDAARLRALWKKLDAEDAADVSSTMAQALGRDKGGIFSPSLFISQVENLSKHARVTAFGQEGAESIENLITLSNAHKRVAGTFNHSKSGVAINSSDVKQGLSLLAGSVGGGYAGGTSGAVAGAAIASSLLAKSYITARMAMSPKVTKWLNGLSKKPNEKAADAHIARLSNIAKTEPTIAADIINMQEWLMSRTAGSPQALAAKDSGQQEKTEQSPTTRTIGGLQ